MDGAHLRASFGDALADARHLDLVLAQGHALDERRDDGHRGDVRVSARSSTNEHRELTLR